MCFGKARGDESEIENEAVSDQPKVRNPESRSGMGMGILGIFAIKTWSGQTGKYTYKASQAGEMLDGHGMEMGVWTECLG